MKKVKFHIKGMNCTACVKLIENILKDKTGVIEAKVNLESQKGVVAYQEGQITPTEIYQTVAEAGEYEAVAEEEEAAPAVQEQIPVSLGGATAQPSFWTGLLSGIAIISVILNVVLLVNYFKSPTAAAARNNGTINQYAAPSANQPTAPAPTVGAVQTFNITKNDHLRGNFNAPITLVEFSDFECPFCGRAYPTFKQILSEYGDKVRLVYKQFPLTSIHQNAQKAAEASECADEQDQFWQYHDKLFDNQSGGFSVDKFKQWAKDLGLDSTKFNNCLDTGKYASKVAQDAQEGQTKGVNGTPATFVNGQLVSGAQPYTAFKQVIDSLLK